MRALGIAGTYAPMPRYFYHVIDDDLTEDGDGADLPDVSAAKQFAIRSIYSMMYEVITCAGAR